MKKITLLSFFLLSLFSVTYAQTTVKGVLKDSLTNVGESNATIKIIKNNDTKNKTILFLTDLDGNFSKSVQDKGEYTIVFAPVGKLPITKKITISGEKTIDLGAILTRYETKNLADVDVVSQKRIVKMDADKTTYSVEDDADSKTATLMDMLRKVPMVVVDGQDNITVNGSSAFQVYVNGVPNPQMTKAAKFAFKSIPAAAVKSIEVISNPGAEYDAEGVGGILNVVFKSMNGDEKQPNSTSGMVGLWGGIKALGAHVSVNSHINKFNIGASLTFQQQQSKDVSIDISRTLKDASNPYSLKKGFMLDYKQPYFSGSLNVDYHIDSIRTLSLSTEYTYNSDRNFGPTTIIINRNSSTAINFNGDLDNDSPDNSVLSTLTYRRIFNKERTKFLNISYQFLYNPTNIYSETSYDDDVLTLAGIGNKLSENRTKTIEHSALVDYAMPLSKKNTIFTGAKLTMRNSSSNSQLYDFVNDDFVLNDILSQRYKYNNNILAAYVKDEQTFGLVKASGGLRYEHTWIDASYLLNENSNVKKNYGVLVPTVSLSLNAGPMATLGLSYGMRVSRPGISYLNPYKDITKTDEITYGNTELDVEKTHNIDLTMGMYTSNLMFNFKARQSFSPNKIESYSFFDDQTRLNTTYGNIVNGRTSSANLFLSWLVLKPTRLIFNGEGSYTHLESDRLNLRNSGWRYSIVFGVQQDLPWKLKANVYYIAKSKAITLQGSAPGFSMITTSLNRTFLEDRLNLGLTFMSGMSKHGDFNFVSTKETPQFIDTQAVRVPVQSIMFTATYNFGNATKTKGHPGGNTKEEESTFIEKEGGVNLGGGSPVVK